MRRSCGLFALAALTWALLPSGSAAGGYDIAHIIERTCQPGGALIVSEAWKGPRFEDRILTEPGEVIGCLSVGREGSLQIAVGPQRIGSDRFHCVYFSLMGREGADVCLTPGPGSFTDPLMVVRLGNSRRLAVTGIASLDGVGLAPEDQVGTRGRYAYYSVDVPARAVCDTRPVGLLRPESSSEDVAKGKVTPRTAALDSTDSVPHGVTVKRLCESLGRAWATDRAAAIPAALLGALSELVVSRDAAGA